MKVVDRLPSEHQSDIYKLGVTLKLISLFPGSHRLIKGSKVKYGHPCDCGSVEGATDVISETARVSEGIVEIIAETTVQYCHMQQIHRRLRFSCKFREQEAMPLFVEVVVGSKFRTVDKIVVGQPAVIVIRIGGRIYRWIAWGVDGRLVEQINGRIHCFLTAIGWKADEFIDHIHGNIMLCQDRSRIVPVVDPVGRQHHHKLLGLEVCPGAGMVPLYGLPFTLCRRMERLGRKIRGAHSSGDVHVYNASGCQLGYIDVDTPA